MSRRMYSKGQLIKIIQEQGGGTTLYLHQVQVNTTLSGETKPALFNLISSDATPYTKWNFLVEPELGEKYFSLDVDKAWLVPNVAKIGSNGPVFHAVYGESTFLNMSISGQVVDSYQTGPIVDTVTEL